jgi:hypothetical protein
MQTGTMDQYFNNDVVPTSEAAASGDGGSEGPWFPDISSPYDQSIPQSWLPQDQPNKLLRPQCPSKESEARPIHPVLQLLDQRNASKLYNTIINGEMKNALQQYFVENQVSKPSHKFLKAALGCEDLSRYLLLACIKIIPGLEDMKDTISSHTPLSKEDSEIAQEIIHQYFPSDFIKSEGAANNATNNGNIGTADLAPSRSRPSDGPSERWLYSNTLANQPVTPYESDLLLEAEKYVVSLPECISECIICSD